MSKVCPLTGSTSLSQDCIECESKRECKSGSLHAGKARHKYRQVVIGVDQSYSRTGLSIAADGKLLHVGSVKFGKGMSKCEKRALVAEKVSKACKLASSRSELDPVLVLERIRMFSRKFVSIPYIKSMGAMNASIADTAAMHGVKSYSIDTRAWKHASVGTSKPEANDFGVKPEKWPCVSLIVSMGFGEAVKLPVSGRRQKGCFVDSNGNRWEYDDDACDSAGIALSWFTATPDKFELEE